MVSGFNQTFDFAGTQEFMASNGVPGSLLYVVVALELVGGIALIVGWKSRTFALLLATYCLLAAFLFHTNFADEQQFYSFMKNLGMAGGLLLLTAKGAGVISLDERNKHSDLV